MKHCLCQIRRWWQQQQQMTSTTMATIIMLCISICLVRLLFSVNKFYSTGNFASRYFCCCCLLFIPTEQKHSHCQRDKYYPVTYSLYAIWMSYQPSHFVFYENFYILSPAPLFVSFSLSLSASFFLQNDLCNIILFLCYEQHVSIIMATRYTCTTCESTDEQQFLSLQFTL